MSDLVEMMEVCRRKIEVHLIARPTLPSDATMAPTLRVLHDTLADTLAEMTEAKTDIPASDDLSASLAAVAEQFARWRDDDVTLAPEAVKAMVGLFNELTAHAWALEMALRLSAGQPRPIDRPTLALAYTLARKGVRVGATADTKGGVA